MVETIFYKCEDGLCALSIEGHADFSYFGMDVVCAEISLMSQNILISLLKVIKANVVYDIKNGFLAFDISKEKTNKRLEASKLLIVLQKALKETEKKFPSNLKVSVLKTESEMYQLFYKNLKQFHDDGMEKPNLLNKEKIKVKLDNNIFQIKGNIDIGNYKKGILNAAMTAFVLMIKAGKDEFKLDLSEEKRKRFYQLRILGEDKNTKLLLDTVKEGLDNLRKQYPNNLIFDDKEV